MAADDRDWLTANGVNVIRYPHDKDQTDLELAIQHALPGDPELIIIMAALGARLDHTLGNIALLADESLVDHPCSLDDGVEQVLLCRERTKLHGASGDLVSLLPWGVRVTGVRTFGLKWPLRGEILFPERSRGISNEMTNESAEIKHRIRPAPHRASPPAQWKTRRIVRFI